MKRYTANSLWLFLITVISFGIFSSCSDDDSNGQPEITSVRVCAPEKADSTFCMSSPNRTIVIQGHNLGGARAVYINDQMLSFNPNMNTNHSIIVTIPTEASGFELTVWNPELRPEIRVVTGHGQATYPFRVLAPRQTIERIAGKYPRVAGAELTVIGTNFLDVTRVYFSDINPYYRNSQTGELPDNGNEVDVTDYSVTHNRYFDQKSGDYVTDSQMKLTLPQLSYQTGYLIIETMQGHAVIEYAALPPRPVLTGISSDMPIPGSRVTLKGSYFINVSAIKIGDISVPADEITVEDDESTLSFIMPEKPTATTTISVVTPGGETNIFPFYRYETLLVNFDDLGNDLKYNNYIKEFPVATSDTEPFVSDGKYAFFHGTLTANNDAGPQIYFNATGNKNFDLPGFNVIPASTSADDVYLMFEIYNKYPFTKNTRYGFRWISDGKDHNWDNRVSGTNAQERPEFQDMFGGQPLGQWYTAVIPLSALTGIYDGMTYSDIVDNGMKRLLIQLRNKTDQPEDFFFCIDNIRISTLPTF